MELLNYFKELFLADPAGAVFAIHFSIIMLAGVLFFGWKLLSALEASIKKNVNRLKASDLDLNFDLDLEPGPTEGDILHSNR